MNANNAPAQRPQILAVEDDADVLRLIVRGLTAVGDVTSAVDGQEAYELVIGGLAPDVIVTDLMMPRMDGLTLVHRLKEEGRLGRIPVVILTAKTRAQEVVEGINAGARFYVTKPFEMDSLVGKVRKALQGKSR